MKARVLTPELLDSLPPDDPAAQTSRRDLRRLHPLLGQISLWTRWFAENFPVRPPASLADLGAGDGSLLGTVLLRAYPKGGHGARIFFVDRQPVVPEAALAHFRRCNWLPTIMATDVFQWAEESPPMEAVLANLFLHHLEDEGVTRLFSSLAGRTTCFAAAEPRRSRPAWWAARSLGWIGCHPVTRHDARVSVEAGFSGQELSRLWPARTGWHLAEHEAGPFTHFFTARRTG